MSTFDSKHSEVINSFPISWENQHRNLKFLVKLANLTEEIKILNISMLGVTATWWPDATIPEVMFYYSGNVDKNHNKRIGMLVSKQLSSCIIDFIPYFDRTF